MTGIFFSSLFSTLYTMEEGLCERCGNEPCDCSDPERVEPLSSDDEVPSDQHPGVNAFLPDEEFQCHQPEEEWVPTEAEKDVAMMRVSGVAPKRSHAAKQPHVFATPKPNLEEYFDECNTSEAKRISICRAYASYLAALQPKKKRKVAKK